MDTHQKSAGASRRTERLERLFAANERYAHEFDRGHLPAPPQAGLAVLTCMDARMLVEQIFGLRIGDANVIRNAGALASDDALRSLVLSRHVLGTSEIVVVGHTACGLRNLDEPALGARLSSTMGETATVDFGSFEDLDGHVRAQVGRIREHPWLADVAVHGLVYEVETGRVREVA